MNIIIDSAIAIGTLAIAILAIWGEKVRSILSPPKLEIEVHNNFRGNPNKLTDTTTGQIVGRGIFYHLKVVNK
jgi:hypothetical protein